MTPAERLEQYDYLAGRLIQLNERIGADLSSIHTPLVFSELNTLAGLAREIRGETVLDILAADKRHREFLKRMKP